VAGSIILNAKSPGGLTEVGLWLIRAPLGGILRLLVKREPCR